MGRVTIYRNRALGHEHLMEDYFSEVPTYPPRIMKCCVILHNMILEDERGLNLPCFYDNVGTRVQPERNPSRIHAFLQAHRQIEDAITHGRLRDDLVEHHWQLDGRRIGP